MEISSIILHIESLIFASDRPLTSIEITDLINQAFGFMEDKISPEQIDAAMNGIIEKYNSEFYPFEVRQSGGGWQFLTKKEFHKTVAQLNGEKFLKRLSAAALETLAIIAYKHPITKGEIEAIRGVSSDYSIQKLLEKDLIIITGRNEKLPGHPLVYATSKNFMDYFGINSPEDLPKIREVLSEQVIPTPVNPDVEQSETFMVSNEGELLERSANNGSGELNDHSLNIGKAEEEGEGTSEEGRLFIHDSFDNEQSSGNSNGDEEIPEEAGDEDLDDADFELTDDGYGESDVDDEEILEELDLTSDESDEDQEEDDLNNAEEDEYDENDEDEADPDDMEGLELEEEEMAADDDAEEEDDEVEDIDEEDDDDEDEEDADEDNSSGPRSH